MQDELTGILEILRTNTGLHSDTLDLFRIIKTRFERIEGEQAELRDEVLALSNRIEAVTRLVNGRANAAS